MKSNSRLSCNTNNTRPKRGLTNTCGRRDTSPYVVGKELEVDGPLVGEHATELVGAREIAGGIGSEEGESEEELDENDESEEEKGEGNSDRLEERE